MWGLLKELVVVGLFNVILGTIIGFVLGKVLRPKLPSICDTWNKFYIMEATLFLSGVAIHLFFEIAGINQWFCTNGNACRKSSSTMTYCSTCAI